MKRAWFREHGKGSLELVEEAFHLVRRAPVAALATYYLGALPFVLGLLYFWADMSQSADAHERLVGTAFSLSLLFLWMKFWQAIFAVRLRAHLTGTPSPRLRFRRWIRIAVQQTILQPSSVLLLPIALVAALPFGWVFAFYQNITVLCDGETDAIKPLVKRAWQLCVIWPGQNHCILATLTGFGLSMLINVLMAVFFLPALLRLFFGIETVFTTSPISALNSTSLAAILALTYLAMDPLVKAIYMLRCFYGEALQSGEDLRAELRQIAGSSQPAIAFAVLAIASMLLNPATAIAAENTPDARPQIETPGPGTAAPLLKPADLSRSLDQVIEQRKYAWRMPRTATPDSRGNFFTRFLERIGSWLRGVFRQIISWVKDVWNRLFRSTPVGGDSGSRWMTSSQGLLFLVLAVVLCALALMVYRVLRNRKQSVAVIASSAIPAAPDLTDEDVRADQLPEDEWMKLGRELVGQGELRLAMRAFYLSSLAHLASRNLLALAQYKSNFDYRRELERRAHSLPDLLPSFRENVLTIDRTWYGLKDVTPEVLDHFVSNVEKIKSPG